MKHKKNNFASACRIWLYFIAVALILSSMNMLLENEPRIFAGCLISAAIAVVTALSTFLKESWMTYVCLVVFALMLVFGSGFRLSWSSLFQNGCIVGVPTVLYVLARHFGGSGRNDSSGGVGVGGNVIGAQRNCSHAIDKTTPVGV